jgi:glycosyltransferase involved in cell wall biosynthesis
VAEVAVVVAARDPGGYLREALRSVVDQTFTDWEAVVVDDGSTEDLRWVAMLDPRVRLLTQPPRGLPATRNAGVAATSAPLVAFLDSDDVWEPAKLAAQVEVLDAHPEAPLVDTAFVRIDADGVVIGPGYSGDHRDYLELLHGCGICASTVLVRRATLAAVGGFAPMRAAEDWDLWLRIAQLGGENLRIDDPLCSYRVHSSAMSQDYFTVLVEGSRILLRHRRRARRRSDPAAVVAAGHGLGALRRRTGRQALDRARLAWREGSRSATVRHLLAVALLTPGYFVRKTLERRRHLTAG